MFTVDGIEWDIPCDISRRPEVRASDISGLMLDGTYFYDILGTYMRYDVSLVPNPGEMGDYYAVFEVLTEAVDAHAFVLPYNGSTVQITGRVDGISDIYVRFPDGGVYWKGLKFTVTAIHPTKQPTYQGAITRGMPPLPAISDPEIGDTYTYTENGWVYVDND